MTVAIFGDNGDLIWIDAVLQLDKQYQSQVTSHAVETGVNISDHIIEQNDKFRVRGVITDADFNKDRPQIRSGLNGKELDDEIAYKAFTNYSPVQVGPTITFGPPALGVSLPASMTQFLGNNTPEVKLTPRELIIHAPQLMEMLRQILKRRKPCRIVEYTQNGAYRVHEDLVMTSLTDNIDPDSGDAVYPDMTFERVRYAESKTVKIPQEHMKVKTSKKKAQGKVSTKDSAKTDVFVETQKTENDKLTTKEQVQANAEAAVARGKKDQ
ncbi:phage baseplate protein [Pseudomonas oryzihabitans]|uniref:phage baseplate protein n=1 Tax=Pseudomonas oryzihabitans TaxID=47885 RepID=UPI00363EF3B7